MNIIKKIQKKNLKSFTVNVNAIDNNLEKNTS